MRAHARTNARVCARVCARAVQARPARPGDTALHYCSRFADEETEARGGEVICPSSHDRHLAKPGRKVL